jgi:hypothetical protein
MAQALERGIVNLSERQLRNRIAMVETAIALIEQLERIVAENLLADWD